MNQKPDDGLRAVIRQHLPAHRGRPVQWVTIETGMTQGGVPDMIGTCGRMVWVECKATDAWKFAIRDLQIGFARTSRVCGGPLFYAVRRRPLRREEYGQDQLWLISAKHLDHVLEYGLRSAKSYEADADRTTRYAHRLGTGGPSTWDWQRFGDILFGAYEARRSE